MRPHRVAVAGLAALAVAGCLDLAFMSDVAFAPLVPGLPADQPWVPLPVGTWLTERGIEPVAISACFADTCQPRAVVALFRARGQEARHLADVLADPTALTRQLADRPKRARTRAPVATDVAVEPRREGAWTGLAIHLARRDGGHPVSGVALGSRRGDVLSALLVVAADPDAARRLSRDVAAQAP